MSAVRPCLLLVPAFTELQWTIKPLLEEWAEVASYDPPGVGSEPLPKEAGLGPGMPEPDRRAAFDEWRRAATRRGLEELDRMAGSASSSSWTAGGARRACAWPASDPRPSRGLRSGTPRCRARAKASGRPSTQRYGPAWGPCS